MENKDNPSQETLERWRKDPNNWIWGIFYYNKEDKRIFPPKKMAWMGNTVNFANRNSVILFISILLLIVVLIRFMAAFKK